MEKVEYTVGWICALSCELAAAKAMLDEIDEHIPEQDPFDQNTYEFGRIGSHKIVIACLPAGRYGTNSAAVVAMDMLRTFKSIRIGLMVGIGGGAPSPLKDVRLGDIVVSQPEKTFGGVIQYDLGKTTKDGKVVRSGTLNAPPRVLLTAVARLQADHLGEDSKIPKLLSVMLTKKPKMRSTFIYQGMQYDRLYLADYDHVEAVDELDECQRCDPGKVLPRRPRVNEDPEIHYGTIASGNQVIKNAQIRDRLRDELGALCFEMEAAGLMQDFPCLVVRGICDYADSHKNKRWQHYASATAAAYAKELLLIIPATQVMQERPFVQVTDPELHAIAREQLKEIKEQGNQQRVQYRNDQERQCHQAFKTHGSYEDQKNRNPDRVDGTCKWVLNHPQYQSWCTNTLDGLLWISADPGCGKSVLSKSLVDIDLKSGDSRSTCYFFFKDNDEQNNIQIAICAILHQLFTLQPRLLDHAIPSWERNGPKLQQETEELWRILLSAATNPIAGNVICILDALDECEGQGRQVLIGHLKKFHNSSHARRNFSLKFLITSRPYENIIDQWSGINGGIPTIRLPGEEMSEEISREINLVIEDWVPKLSADKELPQEIQNSLEQRLKQMNHRTYLWLYLVIEELRNSLRRTQKTYDFILDHVPVSVEDAYDRILSKSTNKSQATHLLHIIVAAVRPLTLKEIDMALSIATQEECQSYKDLDLNHTHIETVIRNLCGLFVYVADCKVYLIHQTAKEFLMQQASGKLINTNTWSHSIEGRKAETIMAQICVQYILFKDFDGPAEKGETFEEEDEAEEDGSLEVWLSEDDFSEDGSPNKSVEFEFMNYAAVNWPVHFRHVQFNAERRLLSAGKLLHEVSQKRLQIWFSYYWKAEHPYEGRPQGLSSLHYAALVGHMVVLEALLAMNQMEPDARDDHGRTPLGWAAREGHEGVVRLLLDTGQVEADAKDEGNRTPLCWSAREGHEGVVRLLLDTGRVDADARDEYNWTPLGWAARGDHEGVVRLLLDTGQVDADARDEDNRTPLRWAAQKGHEGVVRLLLDTGRVDADARDVDNRTPLWWAVREGHEGVVRLLLDTGLVDVDVRDEDNRTPLGWAAREGHEEVVRLLLDTGRVDADARDRDDLTPLGWAAREGHERVARFLLDTGQVDADARDEDNRTPLWWAALGDHEGVVRLLLDTGRVDADAKDVENLTPLWWAAQKGHGGVVRLLLDTGRVDADVRGEENWTPLGWAAREGREEVVRLLLDTGQVDADARGEYNWTPLWWAAREGHEEVVRLLLDTGQVDADARGEDNRTPLWWAAWEGHEGVVRLLLDTGQVDADARDVDNWTPLGWAARGGHEGVVRLLLETGRVDADSRDRDNLTPLVWAAREGHEGVVRLLLDTGRVDADARDRDDLTPLGWAAREGHEEVVRLLLDTGRVDADARDRDDLTPLGWAAREGHEEVVRLLLDTGRVDADAKDVENLTPLRRAGREGHEGVVRLLLDMSGSTRT